MMTRLAALALIGVILAACGATVAPSLTTAPSAAPTPAATVSATAAPTARSSTLAEGVAAHITESVTRLMSINDADRIKAWIAVEDKWLTPVQSMPILRPYLIAFTRVLSDQVFDPDNLNYAVAALDIIAAAREVPGVDLP